MAADDEDEILKSVRAQNRSVTFITGSQSVNIDLKEDSSRLNEDSELNETELLLAGILVNEARLGRNGHFKTSPKELRLYKIYNKPVLQILVYFCVWLNLCLAFFEEPAVQGMALPYWATMLLEYICLFVFILRLFHVWCFAAGVKFWRDKKNVIMLSIIVLTFLDMIMYVIFKEAKIPVHTTRWTRVLRPLILINISEGRHIRRAVRNIRKTLPEIANVLVLLSLMIALFTLLGSKLFGKRNLKDLHGKPYFMNYFDVYFKLYVLTTTANNPDIMMPAYDNNAWSSLFFVIFIVVCMYIFVSIFLAVVYKNYRMHMKNEIRASVYRKRRQLKNAFDVLKVWSNEMWVVTQKRWLTLMKEVCPQWSLARVALLWQVLDENNEGKIGRKDFLMLADLLNVKVIEVKDQVNLFERFIPRVYNSRISAKIRLGVCHKYFVYFFDLVIFANAIFIALERNDLEVLFLALFNVEIFLKLYTYGFKEFFARYWNIFDFLVIGAATLALIIETSYESLQSSQGVLDFLMVLRVLRLVKIMGQIKRFQVIIGTVMQVLYYIYAIMGMELFGNLIKSESSYPTPGGGSSDGENLTSTMFCGNIKLKGSDFYADRYCNNNFNNILRSFKVLFDLMVVNQWHIITQGYVLVTNKFARLYFLSFHLLCVIVVLNIFVAFILEAFMLEYSFTHGKIETVINKKIEEKGVGVGMCPVRERAASLLSIDEVTESYSNGGFSSLEMLAMDTGLRFRMPKQQRKNADVLLQEMFEDELGEDDIGPKDLEDLEDLDESENLGCEPSRRKVTFLNVDSD
ncbi:two pore calcium channel protein 1-like isoform X2 [Stylophora pistillata]|uniref:two pore calcium channel protein 1-like isoform X2 n=1 Tax=Stylophora pistillata TaxID=50429 RepID=UPI000C03EEB8|nr:two pore calcium channel protein 1-like isoform X2 [Stylophora pistillata]